jgi:hypothetical protein
VHHIIGEGVERRLTGGLTVAANPNDEIKAKRGMRKEDVLNECIQSLKERYIKRSCFGLERNGSKCHVPL